MPTRSGLVVAGAGLLLLVGGWLLGAPDVAVLGACGPALVAGAMAWVGRPPAVVVHRALPAAPVPAGTPGWCRLTVTNPGRRRTRAMVAEERIGGHPVARPVPALDPGASTTVELPWPTTGRGLVAIGPLTVRRTDSLTLATAARPALGRATVRVHPRIHPLAGAGPVDRPAGADPMAGALRAYVPGDEPRRVHWRSSARAGRLLVTEPVAVAPAETTILLDVRAGHRADDGFEDAVEVAASVAVARATESGPGTVRLLTTAATAVGPTCWPGLPAALDHLAVVTPGPGRDPAATLARNPGAIEGPLVVVAVRPAAGDLAALTSSAGARGPVLVVAVAVDPGEGVVDHRPGLTLVTVPSAAALGPLWRAGGGGVGAAGPDGHS